MTDWQHGIQAFHEGRMREAADRLQAAFSEHDLAVSQLARYETCTYLGASLYSLGLPQEALPAFEAAFKFSPTTQPPDELMMNLTHCYLAAGRREAAREALRFLLAQSPGHVAAGMLAARLDRAEGSDSIAGAVLGTSPETAETYIRTLTFSHTAGGYAPAEVQEALAQLQRFVGGLSNALRSADEKLAQYEREIQRYRQMEDAVVENMMLMQPVSQTQNGEQPPPSEGSLSPIELLFRQKT